MDDYIISLTILGLIILLTAWLPMVLRKLPLSLPILCIFFGIILALSPFSPLPAANPLENRDATERLTELVVIIALMGAGLKLDRKLSWKGWMTTWRLLGIAMPLTIAGITLVGLWVLQLPLASAILLGAALAPTDPVLASDVQVGPPMSDEEDDVRFSLTSEAGLNDGLSFPFVYLAIAIALAGTHGTAWFAGWIVEDVIWRLFAGLAAGWITGRILGYLTFHLPQRAQLSRTGDGFVAIGITLLCYGVTELIHGYGFVAVFVAALTLRAAEWRNSYHQSLHDFTEQVERLLMMLLMVCFGAVIADGALLHALNWRMAVATLLILFVLRPLSGWISLIGAPQPRHEKAVISIFGIRGLGSFYYLAFATGEAKFPGTEILWQSVFLTVLVSIVVHGIAVTPVMRWLDRRAGQDG
ncbi:cation:proton antiporter [Pararhizobium gei]|uniref:cation:proton antiporter n=1 Tax=Pararhizobium gei TaxID=1395951 RepID=UPI0023D97D35|nr:sodium:proton antiporter [Rhizobium gei]